MPPKKYNTAEEKAEAHRQASLKYSRKHAKEISQRVLSNYHENKEKINAKRRLDRLMGSIKPLI